VPSRTLCDPSATPPRLASPYGITRASPPRPPRTSPPPPAAMRRTAPWCLQIVAEHVERHLVPKLQEAQQIERRIWEIHDVLAGRGDHAAAAEIHERIRAAKTAQLVPSASLAEGEQFIAGVLANPSAQLDAVA
jgi:hypothetical protein